MPTPDQVPNDRERLERLERLMELNRTLSASPSLEPFLQALIRTASDLTCSETASVLEPDPDEKHLRFLASAVSERGKLKDLKVPIASSVAGWVYSHGQPTEVAEAEQDARHFKKADLVEGFRTRSILAVPILYQGRALGVLETVNKRDGANYTEEDRTILETLASQAAVAIQTAALTERTRRSLEDARDLERMKADFIAIASHELRTPLGLILGHATYLRETVAAKYTPQLDVIVRSAMRLKEIIDSLAGIDNVQRGMASLRRKPVSMNSLAREVVESLRVEAREKELELELRLAEQELLVDGDAGKIGVALGNLVENAITFTNPGGHIQVLTEAVPGHVRVSVIDDGIGIPQEDLSRIFERFYQVEEHLTRRHGGLGLGLAVAKAMIELHGGRIWAESKAGQGSSFTFLLPVEPLPGGRDS